MIRFWDPKPSGAAPLPSLVVRRATRALTIAFIAFLSLGARASLESNGRLRIIVNKAARRLDLLDGDHLLKKYRVALGTSPTGTKERQGDKRTPEGKYFICGKNPRSTYLLSLELNYPNADDAKRAFDAGLITKRDLERIERASARRQRPPWDTSLGGEIFIHGRGSRTDWTWGCIALDDLDIRELYAAVSVGTPVTIIP